MKFKQQNNLAFITTFGHIWILPLHYAYSMHLISVTFVFFAKVEVYFFIFNCVGVHNLYF